MQAFIFDVMKATTFNLSLLRNLFVLAIIVGSPCAKGQGSTMTLLLEPLESSNDMTWVTQRFELVKSYGTSKRTSISGGLEMQSAVLGNYGGFYAFGFTGGVYQHIASGLHVHLGASLASGGGAGAPDGDGLMYRGFAGIVHRSKLGRLEVGLHHIDFPSGMITSDHVVFGYTHKMPYIWQKQDKWIYPTFFEVVTGLWFLGPEDAGRNSEAVKSAYAGVRVGQYLNTNHTIGAELQLGAGAMGNIDGYMNYSMGVRFNTLSQRLFLRAHLGSGGGGGVYTGGGISSMFSTGIQFGQHQFSVGQWSALTDKASVPFASYSRHFDLNSSFGFHRGGFVSTLNEPTKKVALKVLAGGGQQRSSGMDRNNLPYNPMSGISMGLGIQTWTNTTYTLDAYGHTLWAASGGYGAYAEGLFSLAFLRNQGNMKYGLDATTGIAGGGGIEVGSGIMIAPGLQVEREIGPLSSIKMNFRQKFFPGGNYSPLYFGVELIQSLPVHLW